jgi:hypothetical protein
MRRQVPEILLRVAALSFHGRFSANLTTNIAESDFRYTQPSLSA